MKEAGFLPNVTLNVNIAAPVIEPQEQEAEPAAMMEEEEEDSDSVMEDNVNSSEDEVDEEDDIVGIISNTCYMYLWRVCMCRVPWTLMSFEPWIHIDHLCTMSVASGEEWALGITWQILRLL